MKKIEIYIMLIAFVLFFLGVSVLLTWSSKESESRDLIATDTKAEEQRQADGTEQLLEEMLQEFAKLMYTYDTRERNFYEGTENYTTTQAYHKIMPFLPGKTEEDKGVETATVVSELEETSCYYRSLSETQLEAILESKFILNKNETIVQYLKLSVEKLEKQWKITDISILETIEQ